MKTDWHKLPPGDDVLESRWRRLSPDYFFVILSDRRAEAEKELNDVMSIRLNHERLVHYFGREPKVPDGHNAYLVRGEAIRDMPYGEFTVYSRDKILWVRYGTLGKELTGYVKCPLVVLLETAPEIVYADATMVR